jgi:hypothetical protein
MKWLLFFVAAILLGSTVAAFCEPASAAHPQYLVLRAPAAGPHHAAYGYYPGEAYGVTAPTYAYGWFGAPRRGHWSRQYSYYGNYVDWSQR